MRFVSGNYVLTLTVVYVYYTGLLSSHQVLILLKLISYVIRRFESQWLTVIFALPIKYSYDMWLVGNEIECYESKTILCKVTNKLPFTRC